ENHFPAENCEALIRPERKSRPSSVPHSGSHICRIAASRSRLTWLGEHSSMLMSESRDSRPLGSRMINNPGFDFLDGSRCFRPKAMVPYMVKFKPRGDNRLPVDLEFRQK